MNSAAPGAKKPGLAATKVQVCAARIVGWPGLPVSQSRPLGKSTARIGLPAALMALITRFSGGRGSPWLPVPSKASIIQAAPDNATARSAAIGSPAKNANRHAGFFQHAKIGGRVAGQTRRVGKQKYLDRHLPQIEVPGGDKTVAAVVAFAATDHRPPASWRVCRASRPRPGRRFPSAPARSGRIPIRPEHPIAELDCGRAFSRGTRYRLSIVAR